MKKKKTQKIFMHALVMLIGLSFMALNACDKEEEIPVEDPVASFQYEIDDNDFLQVTFINVSQNAETYSWDFGDGNNSAEENPVHVYQSTGTYEVTLTATNSAGVNSTFSQSIELEDPEEALKMLTGETSKTWKLLREGTSLGIGENMDNLREWWALENDGSRPCVYFHEFTFHRDGTYEFDDKGSFWGEEGVFPEDFEGTCFEAVPANMLNVEGADVSAWLGGTHSFEYDPSAGIVTLTGEGAWIGLPKLATDGEVLVPQSSVTFEISIEEHNDYDLMHVIFDYGWGIWDISYAHYHDPSLEPDVVSFFVDFSFSVEERTVTFENNSREATSYSWDFGDGNTSAEENPVHTYAEDGTYTVVLTGTGPAGTKEATQNVTIDTNFPEEAPPTPTEDEGDVISIYSHAYTDISNVDLNPNWGQGTATEEIEVEGQNILKMAGLDFQGISWEDNAQDVSGKTNLHVDIWCATVTDINISLIGGGAENPVKITTEEGVWKSIDIPLSEYTAPDLTEIIQMKFDDAETGASPTIFVANIYFY